MADPKKTRFFAEVKNSMPGMLLAEELFRAYLTSLVVGFTLALLMLAMAFLFDPYAAFPSLADRRVLVDMLAILVVMHMTFIFELFRRLHHGKS